MSCLNICLINYDFPLFIPYTVNTDIRSTHNDLQFKFLSRICWLTINNTINWIAVLFSNLFKIMRFQWTHIVIMYLFL